MLYKVEVQNANGETLVLPLWDYSSGYLVKPIEGLDPVKANIVSSSFAGIDGEQHQASRRESRNILMKLGLKMGAAGSVSSLRAQLMRFFMPKARIRFTFYREDGPDVDIYGIVETFKCPQFVREPEASISVVCHQPDFYVPHIYGSANYTTPGTDEHYIEYDGTVETGFDFRMTVDRPISQFTIFHRSSDETLNRLIFAEPLVAGDVLTISTVSGDKHVTLTRAGADSSLLYAMSPDSSWLNLFPGPNYIRVYAEGAAIPYTITYTSKVGGL
ncbi:tail protein [Arthrobacter phage Niktson]|uniref:Tail protein n=1 Tax=Arthrobacter phage Niktson TaxID=2014347 RepID=A0A218M5J8_9CAUD|nr:tail protein [Arthrobacter phage Niktson]ASD52252.1 tail protein [Arthrobacter phage Niktson]ASD52345.1 tail protein [Arthrobacter phage ElephantMan]